MIWRIIKMFLYYIIGFGIFYLVLYLTQNAVLSIIGLSRDEVDILLDSLIVNIILYSVLYLVIDITFYIYDRASIKSLNEKLVEMKERVKENEKTFGTRHNNSTSSNNMFGDI